MNMDTAPKDGTRILIKMWTWGYNSGSGRQERTGGTEIAECWWDDGLASGSPGWQVWCGDRRTTSTAFVDPIAWASIPPELANES